MDYYKTKFIDIQSLYLLNKAVAENIKAIF